MMQTIQSLLAKAMVTSLGALLALTAVAARRTIRPSRCG